METQRILEARNGQLMHEPKLISGFSDQHLILFNGEGNCSFSSWLATAFGAATNIVATTKDSRDDFLQKYGMEGEFNTSNLSQRGAHVFHGFDACKMATQHKSLLCGIQMSYFDRIIFNFPHAGFLGREKDAHLIKKHKKLVRQFFANARHMLLPGGQVHVSHKLGHPYDEWKLEEQAQLSGLRLVKRVRFHQKNYPGYRNCRGDGTSAGESFDIGRADTYIFEARIEKPPKSSLNVREPLKLSSTVLAHRQSLKEKAVCNAGASQMTSLHQVLADEVTGLEKLQRGKKKMKTLETLKPSLQQRNLENSPTSLSCTTKKPPASTLNAFEPVGMSTTTTKPAQLKWVVRNDGASQMTSLQQVLADEVTGLENLQLGKKRMKTLETPKPALQQMNMSNCQGPSETRAEDLGGSLEEEHAKIIEMDMASLSNSTNVKCNSQYIGCTESTLPSFTPQTKPEDMILVSHVNPKEVLVLRREETTKSHLTLDSSLGLSQGLVGTISTVDKTEEEIREDCTKQKSPLLEIHLVALLQRNVSCAAMDQHTNSGSIVGDHVGMSSTMMKRRTLKSALTHMNLKNLQSVEASMEGRAEDTGIVLEEENEEITDVDMAVSASLSSAANIESLGSQSSGCTKPLSPETGDRLFPVNPGNEVFEKAEDTTKSHDILEPSPQFSKVSAAESTIWTTIDKVEEDAKVDCQQEFQLPGIQLMDDVAPLLRKKESSDLEESSSLNEKLAGCLTVLPHLWEVLWRHLQRI